MMLRAIDADDFHRALKLATLVDSGQIVLLRCPQDPRERFEAAVRSVFVDEETFAHAYLRLLSLLDVTAIEPLDSWSRSTASGLDIHEALVRAASYAPCNSSFGFDLDALNDMAETEAFSAIDDDAAETDHIDPLSQVA